MMESSQSDKADPYRSEWPRGLRYMPESLGGDMVSVLLVKNQQMMRDALASLLNAEPNIDVLADLEFSDQVAKSVKTLIPDVVVLDVDMPATDGLQVAHDVRTEIPCRPILLLADRPHSSTVRRAIELRVEGFILKDAPFSRLLDAVCAVGQGERVIDSDLAFAALDPAECPLSGREIDLLRLWAQSLSPPEIAERLRLSPGTVRNYLAAAVTKLEARNRVDAVRIAIEANWI